MEQRFVIEETFKVDQFLQFIWNFPLLQPVKNLRLFFAILLMDSSLGNNATLILKIKHESLGSALLEAFLESAPQFILQLYIILSTGNITVSQYVSIPISFLSLSLSSTKLFYSQRLGMFMNADPSPKQLLAIFPLVILQIIGPLISLVFVALYLRQFIFLCIIFIIVTNYLVLKIVLFKCQPFDSLRELYRESRQIPITSCGLSSFKQDSQRVFLIAIFTSWLTTTTVWVNNFTSRSKFLITSSIASCFSHMVCISCVYIQNFYGTSIDVDMSPLTHCFSLVDLQSQSFNVTQNSNGKLVQVEVCRNDTTCSTKTVRVCDTHEQPTDLFSNVTGPVIFLLLLLSLISSLLLQFLGNYHNLYKLTDIICCKKPILHVSMLHDYLKHSDVLDESLRDKMSEIWNKTLELDSSIVNLRDSLHGSTCMHYALGNKMYKELGDMIEAGADFNTKNDYCVTPISEITERLQNCGNIEEELILHNLIIKIEQMQTEKRNEDEDCLVWSNPPMHEACKENKVLLLVFFTLIGGHWGAQDSKGSDVQICFLKNIEKDQLTLSQHNYLVKQYLANQHDQYGQSILHYAVKFGYTKSLKILLNCNVNINMKFDNGDTLLHNAASWMQLECLKLLLSHGANVNARCILGETPLHQAVSSGDVLCVQVLIENNADVNAKSNIGLTPIHKAAIFGRVDCLQLLINSNGDVNAVNIAGNTPLHRSAKSPLMENLPVSTEDREKCFELLICAGANLNLKNDEQKVPLDFPSLQDFKRKRPDLFEELNKTE